jgi:hypothetical protein
MADWMERSLAAKKFLLIKDNKEIESGRVYAEYKNN